MQNTNFFIKPNEQRKNKERSFYIAIATAVLWKFASARNRFLNTHLKRTILLENAC